MSQDRVWEVSAEVGPDAAGKAEQFLDIMPDSVMIVVTSGAATLTVMVDAVTADEASLRVREVLDRIGVEPDAIEVTRSEDDDPDETG